MLSDYVFLSFLVAKAKYANPIRPFGLVGLNAISASVDMTGRRLSFLIYRQDVFLQPPFIRQPFVSFSFLLFAHCGVAESPSLSLSCSSLEVSWFIQGCACSRYIAWACVKRWRPCDAEEQDLEEQEKQEGEDEITAVRPHHRMRSIIGIWSWWCYTRLQHRSAHNYTVGVLLFIFFCWCLFDSASLSIILSGFFLFVGFHVTSLLGGSSYSQKPF